MTFTAVGLLLFYGAYNLCFYKTTSMLNYSKIIEQKNSNNAKDKNVWLLHDFNRGGIILDRFLYEYSSYLFSLDIEDIEENDFVLNQLQCKANEIIMLGDADSVLLTQRCK